ncbi:apoptosis-stimulating of p53 protein 1 isoform X3 [Plutella xylostella]|uniref:apoptosis-stimulating of p53 protein 1 isoform X3 n=1 Tax=Plutella xylostella TaxID=51655 RepID=UPI002032E910|nr:apoptosis-stimulating of p53 protein 1 isoform X3 [Plutella xylostella]XP_048483213.1 apoptosis-stimulating of p53 protein 1 isoform X3 [Plutella xylostella]XP_048483214.1 apoptosis-stimulating of p53 protein 1 isoform X3 [Plutella xylostella]
MECGQLTNGLRWSAYTTSSDSHLPSILIDDALASGDEQCINDNYLITFPDDESDIDSAYDPKDRFEEVDSENESGKLPRCYENPLFIPRDLKTADWRDSGVQSEAARFGNYKFLNDFDIECEGEEAVPVVYLSCSRAARLQRSLRLAGYKKLGEGVELTLGELRAMALRQQQQIDTQHQLLCAKEQRLRYLKQQEARQHQVAVEGERLRRLRERVEAQELKLRRLRALRGQLDRNKQANIALTSDLESIRALFNEKEKELSVAVAKVEELTRQLEELRRGRASSAPPPAHELDKLRRELMYRNKLNEQQNGRLSAQRAALGVRQEEMRSIDRRVSELQARLLRKRALNRQLAAAHRQQPQQRTNNPTPMQQLPNYPTSGSNGISSQPKNQQTRGNIAAVEPYNHVPHAQSLSHNQNFQALKQNVIQNNVPLKQLTQPDNIQSHLTQQEAHYLQQKQMINPLYNGGYNNLPPGIQDSQYQGQYPNKHADINSFSHVQQGISNAYDQKAMFEHINKYPDYPKQPQYSPNSTSSSNSNQNGKELKINEQEFLPEFAASKSDPKYQTLPYNTKFPQNATGKIKQDTNSKNSNELSQESKNQNQNAANINHMTVHSTPLSVVNKSLATPLSQTEATYQQDQNTYQLQKSDSSSRCNQEGKENQAYPQNNRLSQSNSTEGSKSNGTKSQQGSTILKGSSPSLGSNTTGSSSSLGFGKPVSSVAPTTVQVSSGRPSPIYQTSSTKIQPVQPQTVQTSVQNSSNVINPVASNPVVSQPQIVRNTASGLSSSASAFGQNASSQSILLSPPQSASTPLSTPDVSGTDKSPKPALPPKPTIKTPPRQSANNDTNFQAKDQDTALPTLPIPDNSSNDSDNPSREANNEMIIKARPLTIRKPPLSEQPKLRNMNTTKNGISVSINRRIEMPPAFLFPEMDHLTREAPSENGLIQKRDEVDKALNNNVDVISNEKMEEGKEVSTLVSDVTEQISSVDLNGQDGQLGDNVLRRSKKGNLKQGGKAPLTRRVSFDPLALLLDASLEGELELVKKTATQVQNASAANDEGITALHNAICAGHFEIVKFLVELGCDVNAQDSDGWTPLHCAASCNNLPIVRFLVEHGACIFATTLSDHETAAEKCEEDEEGFDGCSEYLYSIQEKLGIMNGGTVYAVFPYSAARSDELTFSAGTRLQVLRKGDDSEREWWWSRASGAEGYAPRNLLGLYPRVTPKQD